MGSGLVSPLHIIVLLLIVLLVFGAKRLPELGRGLGSGMREFKDAVTGENKEPRPAVTASAEQPQPPASQPQAQPPAAAEATPPPAAVPHD